MIHLKTAHGQKFYEKKVKLFNYAKKHGNVEKYKTYLIGEKHLAEIREVTRLLARELKVVGLMNIQFAIADGRLLVLEVNPRASRTVPFVAKVIGEPIAKIASRVMSGESLKSFGLKKEELQALDDYFGDEKDKFKREMDEKIAQIEKLKYELVKREEIFEMEQRHFDEQKKLLEEKLS